MKILLIISVVLLTTFNPAAAGQTLKEIMTPPADSADRENLRIWLPIERRSKCRLTVEILDSDNQVIRHLVDFLAGPGYYNFYWDRKTELDSNIFTGKYAWEGEYTYRVNNCGKVNYGSLIVDYYKKIEKKISVSIYASSSISISSPEDTMRIKVEWYKLKDSLVDPFANVRRDDSIAIKRAVDWINYVEGLTAVILDTLLSPGTHEIVLSKNKKGLERNVKIDPNLSEGKYVQVISFNGSSTPRTIDYKK